MTATEIDAITFLTRAIAATTKFNDGAVPYLDLLKATPRPAMKVGAFYKTFDGSIVQIVKEIEAVICERCDHMHTELEQVLVDKIKETFGEDAIIKLLHLSNPPRDNAGEAYTSEASHHSYTEKSYVCAIVSGGHGNKNEQGESIGECYKVDRDGLAIIKTNTGETTEVLELYCLSLIGLSLSRRVSMAFSEE